MSEAKTKVELWASARPQKSAQRRARRGKLKQRVRRELPLNDLGVLKAWLDLYGIRWARGRLGGPNVIINNRGDEYGLPCIGIAVRLEDPDETPDPYAKWIGRYSNHGWAARAFCSVNEAISWLRMLGLGKSESRCA